MSKKKTLKEWQIESNRVHNGEFIIMEEPKNANHPVNILHKKCSNIIKTNLNNHKRGYCKYCSGKHKRNLEEWQIESNKIHNNQFVILEEPKNGKIKVEIKHKKCGYVFHQTMNNHINHRNGCPKCSSKIPIIKMSLKNLQEISDEIHGKGEYKILQKPKYIRNKVNILHKKCGNISNQMLSNHLSRKNSRGCVYCYGNLPKTLSELQEISDQIHGKDEYKILQKPSNYYDYVKVKHNICGTINKTNMKLHITEKCKCTLCSESSGEKTIRRYLMENKLNFETQKKFEGCMNKRKLPFDFFLPDLNICIEYDGIQLFKPIEIFGGIESYLKLLKRDQIKNEFCLKKDIKLIRISYLDDISEKLKKELS